MDNASYRSTASVIPDPRTFGLCLPSNGVVRALYGILSLFVLFCVLAGAADAAQVVGTPSFAPVAVYVNEPTLATVVSKIAADPALIPNSVTLVRVDASGQAIANLGPMYDDGTHGDAVAGDGNFTTQVNLTEPASGTVGFVVTAAYRGQLKRVRSSPLFLPVVTRATDAQRQEVTTLVTDGATLFNSRSVQVGDAQALVDLVNFLKAQPGVLDALISSDATAVKIVFTSGLRGAILTSPVGTKGSGAKESAASLTPSYPLLAAASQLSTTSTSQLSSAAIVPSPGSTAALVLQPFASQPGSFSPDESSNIANGLSQTCAGPTVPLKDSGVTVDVMKTLPQYGVISISTHGVVLPPDPTDPNGPSEYVSLFTGERDVGPVTADIQLLQDAQLIIPVAPRSAPTVAYWGVTPRFLQTFAAGGYRDSVVYLSACDSLITTSISDIFLLNGAAAVLGYNVIVLPGTTFNMGTAFFSQLTNVSLPPASRTVSAAYAASNPVSAFILDTLPGYPDVALCALPTVHLNPFGTHNLSDGPFQVEVVDGQITPIPAPADITVTLRRDVISQCSGLLFSSNRTVIISQNQITGGSLDAAGRDPACNTLPITTRWTVLQAVEAPNMNLDLSIVPPAQLTVSIIR